MRLSVALNGYWLSKQLDFSPNTVAKYRRVFARLSAYLGDVELERVATEDIRRFLIHLRENQGLGRRSVYDAWAVLSSLWTWAAGEFGIPHIIRGKMTAPGYTQRQIEPYSEAELRALLGAVAHQRAYTHRTGKRIQAKSPTALRDKAIVLTLLDSGLRVSELCALTLADYDAARGRFFQSWKKRQGTLRRDRQPGAAGAVAVPGKPRRPGRQRAAVCHTNQHPSDPAECPAHA